MNLATTNVGGRFASKSFTEQIRRSNRSWWEARMLGGRTVGEWQTTSVIRSLLLPLRGLQSQSKWEDLDHSKLAAARLWCPDGRAAEVDATGPNRIFQFKVGTNGMGGHTQEAHVLGTLADDDANVEAWEWRTVEHQLIRWRDNFLLMHKRWNVGPFSAEAVGVCL